MLTILTGKFGVFFSGKKRGNNNKNGRKKKQHGHGSHNQMCVF